MSSSMVLDGRLSGHRRVALVTGAGGGGIGTAVAIRLAKSGLCVGLNGRREDRLQEVADVIHGFGGQTQVLVADVAVAAQMERATETLKDRFGSVDVLVHSAAPDSANEPVENLTDECWETDFKVIAGGAFHCCRAVVPQMKRRAWGRLVFLSSSAALRGTWGRGAQYAAAKAALHGLTVRLALELGEFQITVNCVAPSQIDTPRIRKGGRRTDASLQNYAKTSVPLGRIGTPEDVAALVCFLASEDSSYLTGQIITLDGGASLAARTTLPVQPGSST